MSASTETSDEGVPEKGLPGVDSSMYRPYSGWKVGIDALHTSVRMKAQSLEGARNIPLRRLEFFKSRVKSHAFQFI